MKLEEKKLLETGEGLSTVTVDGNEWKDLFKKAKNRLSQRVVIPGFRKGKAPQSKIESFLSTPKVLGEAANMALEPAWKYALDNKKDLQPFTSPRPIIKVLEEDKCVIEFYFDLKPEIEVKEYKGIKPKNAKKEVAKAEEKDIQASIDAYRERYVMEKEKEKGEKIEEGDSVTFDFEGFVDGVAFKGGKGSDFVLVIGKGQMIPGFEDAMVGLSHGKSKIKVKFPKDYTPELSEKDAEFELSIKTIKQRILPNVDDEFVKDLNIEAVNTVKELKAELEKRVIEQKSENMKKEFVKEVISEIAKNSKLIIPKSAVLEQVNTLFKEFEQNLMTRRMTLADYKKQTGLNEQQIKEELFDDAKERLESYLVTDAVRNSEKFEITEAEINKKYESLAKSFGMKPEDIRNKLLQDDQIKEEISKEKIINFLYENNG